VLTDDESRQVIDTDELGGDGRPPPAGVGGVAVATVAAIDGRLLRGEDAEGREHGVLQEVTDDESSGPIDGSGRAASMVDV